jgi:hypothetical protein
VSAVDDGGFVARWSRRKTAARSGTVTEPAPAAAPVGPLQPTPPAPVATATATAAPAGRELAQDLAAGSAEPAAPPPPPPTWDDVADLTPEADFSRFVAGDVDPGVRNAAMKKLFSDPHYNLMDGLDTYIDDYGKPDPIPPDMLRRLAQSRMLRLFDDTDDDKHEAAEAAPPAEPHPRHDEDPDLQLQPDDAAGAPAGEPGGESPGGDPAGQR